MLFGMPLQLEADAHKGALGQDKMTRESLPIGLFKDLGPPFNGRLIYGWPKTANAGPGFNGKPLFGSRAREAFQRR